MSVSSFNRRWATVILEALTRHGVRHVCIAPGSRSTPLTLAAAENRALFITPILTSVVSATGARAGESQQRARGGDSDFRHGGGKPLSGAD